MDDRLFRVSAGYARQSHRLRDLDLFGVGPRADLDNVWSRSRGQCRRNVGEAAKPRLAGCHHVGSCLQFVGD
jgi:hypothetical protein